MLGVYERMLRAGRTGLVCVSICSGFTLRPLATPNSLVGTSARKGLSEEGPNGPFLFAMNMVLPTVKPIKNSLLIHQYRGVLRFQNSNTSIELVYLVGMSENML